MIKIDGLDYYYCKSSQISLKKINDFVNVENSVFNSNLNCEWFDWKYKYNIYGDSIIVIVYDKKKPVAARTLWRNDINLIEAFQPADTAVCKDYRRMGIFSNMTKIALDQIHNQFLYNYPNPSSLPGYISLGWKVHARYNIHLLYDLKLVEEEVSATIDEDYLKWRYLDKPQGTYYYINKQDKLYLLSRYKYNCYLINGRITHERIGKLKKAFCPIVFYYSLKEAAAERFSNRITAVTANNKESTQFFMPIFKGDFL